MFFKKCSCKVIHNMVPPNLNDDLTALNEKASTSMAQYLSHTKAACIEPVAYDSIFIGLEGEGAKA